MSRGYFHKIDLEISRKREDEFYVNTGITQFLAHLIASYTHAPDMMWW
jgi:hypothetical protein